MPRKKWGRAWKLSHSAFVDCVAAAKSLREVCSQLKSSYLCVRGRVADERVDISHFKPYRQPLPLEGVMVENSTYKRSNLKKQIIEKGILPYICAVCGCSPSWNGRPLVLRLDHINGVNNDHRKENLRFLCPNCDSQQPTFSGRNVRWCNGSTSRSGREGSTFKP